MIFWIGVMPLTLLTQDKSIWTCAWFRQTFSATDSEMLFRAMNNIVNNAVKYTNSGGIILGVRRRFGGQALFVMDSGIGNSRRIAEQYL